MVPQLQHIRKHNLRLLCKAISWCGGTVFDTKTKTLQCLKMNHHHKTQERVRVERHRNLCSFFLSTLSCFHESNLPNIDNGSSFTLPKLFKLLQKSYLAL